MKFGIQIAMIKKCRDKLDIKSKEARVKLLTTRLVYDKKKIQTTEDRSRLKLVDIASLISQGGTYS